MSAWMIDAAHADFLATAYVHRVKPQDPRPIGQTLMNECAASIVHRYPSDTDAQPEAADYAFKEWPDMANVDPAMIAYAIGCYEYQACEHPGWEKSSAKAMMAELFDTIGDVDKERSRNAAFGTWPWGIEEDHRAQSWRRPDMQPAEPEPTYGDSPKEATAEQRKQAREAIIELATTGSDDEFDELGQVLSLGIEIERMLTGIDLAMDLAAKVGARTAAGAGAITHKGHEYHVHIERCPNCEAAKKEEASEPGLAEAAPDDGTNDALAPKEAAEQ